MKKVTLFLSLLLFIAGAVSAAAPIQTPLKAAPSASPMVTQPAPAVRSATPAAAQAGSSSAKTATTPMATQLAPTAKAAMPVVAPPVGPSTSPPLNPKDFEVWSFNMVQQAETLEKEAASLQRKEVLACVSFDLLREKLIREAIKQGLLSKKTVDSPSLQSSFSNTEMAAFKKNPSLYYQFQEAEVEYNKSCGGLRVKFDQAEKKLEAVLQPLVKASLFIGPSRKIGYGFDAYRTDVSAPQAFGIWLMTKMRRFVFQNLSDQFVYILGTENKALYDIVHNRLLDSDPRCFTGLFEEGIMADFYRVLGATKLKTVDSDLYLSRLQCANGFEYQILDRALTFVGGLTMVALKEPAFESLKMAILQSLYLLALPVVDKTKISGQTPAWKFVQLIAQNDAINKPQHEGKNLFINRGGNGQGVVDLWYAEKNKWTRLPLCNSPVSSKGLPSGLVAGQQMQVVVSGSKLKPESYLNTNVLNVFGLKMNGPNLQEADLQTTDYTLSPFKIGMSELQKNVCTNTKMESYISGTNSSLIDSSPNNPTEAWSRCVTMQEIRNALQPEHVGMGKCGLVGQIKYGGDCPKGVCDKLYSVIDVVGNLDKPGLLAKVHMWDTKNGKWDGTTNLYFSMGGQTGIYRLIEEKQGASVSVEDSAGQEPALMIGKDGFVADQKQQPSQVVFLSKTDGFFYFLEQDPLKAPKAVARRVSCFSDKLLNCGKNCENSTSQLLYKDNTGALNACKDAHYDGYKNPDQNVDFFKNPVWYFDILGNSGNTPIKYPTNAVSSLTSSIMVHTNNAGTSFYNAALLYIDRTDLSGFAVENLKKGGIAQPYLKSFLNNKNHVIKAFDDVLSPYSVNRQFVYPMGNFTNILSLLGVNQGFLDFTPSDFTQDSNIDAKHKLVVTLYANDKLPKKPLMNIPLSGRPKFVHALQLYNRLVVITDKDFWIANNASWLTEAIKGLASGRAVPLSQIYDMNAKKWGFKLDGVSSAISYSKNKNEMSNLYFTDIGNGGNGQGRLRKLVPITFKAVF